MKIARSWQIVDVVIACIMFVLAISMLAQTSWF
jgi:arginine exporter protein ArgO